jgi:hypothetical protein
MRGARTVRRPTILTDDPVAELRTVNYDCLTLGAVMRAFGRCVYFVVDVIRCETLRLVTCSSKILAAGLFAMPSTV